MKKPSLSKVQKQYVGLFVGAVVVIGLGMLGKGLYDAKIIGEHAWPALDGGVYASAVTRGGVTSLVPGDQLYDSGVTESGIPALTNPKYVSVLAADGVTSDSLLGIDVAIGGEHRFYPVQIMNWHEVVNDSWGGKDIAVTYCPLCGTGVVYDRHLEEKTVTLNASGKLYNNNTVLKDSATGSLWVQGLGEAVQGPMMGKTLTVLPSTMISWKNWKGMYPSGLVLSTNTGVTRDYTRHPYGGYDTSKGLYFPVNHTDPNFTSKAVVYGVTDGTNGVAFWDTVLAGTGMTQTTLGDTSIVALYDFDTKIVRVFKTTSAKNIAHTFTFDFAKRRLMDEVGNQWNMFGEQMTGADVGDTLPELTTTRGFWFCVSALHPTWTADLGTTSTEEVK